MTSVPDLPRSLQPPSGRARFVAAVNRWRVVLFVLLSLAAHLMLGKTEGWFAQRPLNPPQPELTIELVAPEPEPAPKAPPQPPVLRPTPKPAPKKKPPPPKITKRPLPKPIPKVAPRKPPDKPKRKRTRSRPPRRLALRLTLPRSTAPDAQPQLEKPIPLDLELKMETTAPPNPTRSRPRRGSAFRVVPARKKVPSVALVHRLTTAPALLKRVYPDYPERLIENGVAGSVVLWVRVQADGSVVFVRFLKRLHPILDRNSRRAVARLRFKPGKILLRQVNVELPLTFSFVIR